MQEYGPRGTSTGIFGTALIVAHPGTLRDALSALLSAMPEIKVVAVTASLESALESVADGCPSIIMLHVGGLDAGLLAGVQALKDICPRTRIIALARDREAAHACEAGAFDAVLKEGVPPAGLTETISGLLSSTAETMPEA